MGLSQALLSASAGLRVAQASLSVVSSNVANADTPGYARRTISQTTTTFGGDGAGVRSEGVNRALSEVVQRQLRVEYAGSSYADISAQFYDRLQQLFGQPDATGALETTFNNFTDSLQALSTSPEQASTRSQALGAAQQLAQQLNSLTANIQGLRTDAEAGLSSAVASANSALQTIATINQKISASTVQDGVRATLEDQRDNAIDALSKLIDIRVVDGGNGTLSIFTGSGTQLVGLSAERLDFQARGTINATAQWNADPAKSGVGTVSLVSGNGQVTDLIANGSIRSGQIAGLIEARDKTLVDAQNQLDALAAGLAQALSDRSVAGTAATSGAQQGYDIDLTGLQAGNPIEINYTDNVTGKAQTVTFVRVDDPSALPLPNAATANPNDRVVGISFAGGAAGVASQIGTALGSAFTVSNPSGNTLRVLDDGAAATVDINAVSATRTVTSLADGGTQLPFFVDATVPYTGKIAGSGSQLTGLAGRIAVNGALLADPSKLVNYDVGTAAGDSTRPNFILDQLTAAARTFPAAGGVGTPAHPFTGTVGGFLRQVLTQQGEAAANAASLKSGQDVVVNALQQRFDDDSGVNIDQEMTQLLQLQSAYAANARVLSAVKDLLDLLSKI